MTKSDHCSIRRMAASVLLVGLLGVVRGAHAAGAPAPALAVSPPAPLSAPAGFLSSTIPSPQPPHAWVRQTFTVPHSEVPPSIDGKLDDACWKSAMHVAGFFRPVTSASIPEQTEVWICADARRLYVAYHCLDSHPELIHQSETQRNGNIGSDDYVGVDIDSQDTRRNVSTFQVNARGTQLDYIEGGTADNITWAGDWRASTARTSDGWTCEMSIPFALLRYPKGAHEFGLYLYRKMARETTLTGWPYLPPQAVTSGQSEAEYLCEFNGIDPPFFAPKPVFLPYTLTTIGAGSAAREGMDVKYPLSTTLTGVATINPDFQTIEQDVNNVSFSYTQKYLNDHRPFFAEGAGFLPDSLLFYSRAIGDIDGGVKVAGKQGNTTLGLLGTTLTGRDGQSATVLNMSQDIGQLSNAGFSFVGDDQSGQPSNRVGRVYGSYGFRDGTTTYRLSGDHNQSWLDGSRRGGRDYVDFHNEPTQGRLSFGVQYQDIAPDFISRLGFVPETDKRGWSSYFALNNTLARGAVESYHAELDEATFQHHTGGYFEGFNTLSGVVNLRSGWAFSQGVQTSGHERNHDWLEGTQAAWNQKTLLQQGSVEQDIGRFAGQSYNFLAIQQGFLITHPFSVQVAYDRSILGSTTNRQLIVTGTYRLSTDRTMGARIITQDGQTNLFFSYGQQVRAGSDIFLLFGDPNSLKTRGIVTLKVVRPLSL